MRLYTWFMNKWRSKLEVFHIYLLHLRQYTCTLIPFEKGTRSMLPSNKRWYGKHTKHVLESINEWVRISAKGTQVKTSYMQIKRKNNFISCFVAKYSQTNVLELYDCCRFWRPAILHAYSNQQIFVCKIGN